ncbi:MAG: phosphatase PAP2 family protein [Candidatus Rokubacteria bacterium]|nr:phosphatase PAP2 family protein [Candidatus Rokubacteria bacterium]
MDRAFVTLAAFVLVALSTSAAGATAVRDWNAAALEELRNGKLGPPMAARALAIAHTCMYDAWAAYDKDAAGTIFGDDLRRPPREHTRRNKAEAVSFAAYRCLLNLFPAGAARLGAVMQGMGYDPANTSVDVRTPAGIGNVAAAAVVADRRHDGSNQYGDMNPPGDPGLGVAYSDYTGYQLRNEPLGFCMPTMEFCPPLVIADPFHWQPLIGPPPLSAVQKYIGCHWENVRPFALRSANQFDHLRIAQPRAMRDVFSLRRAADEVIAHSAALTDEKKLVVEYWADGPASELPPGHWGIFAQYVSKRDRHTIDEDAKMFFAMHNASFDAGIVAWHLKRSSEGVRPITAIRHLYQGQQILAFGGPGQPVTTIPGSKWMPYNPGSNLTPAFPGFISGHSTFSAASAYVLRAFTGSDRFGFRTLVPAGFGRVEPGIPAVDTIIAYATFTEAADAAAISRIWGGIHFSEDNESGLALGTLVGEQAWQKAVRYFRERSDRRHDRGRGGDRDDDRAVYDASRDDRE